MAVTSVRARTAIVVAGIGLVASSCAGRSGTGAQARSAPATTAVPVTTPSVIPTPTPITVPTTTIPPVAGRSVLPDLTVDNVAGGTVNLASLAPSPKPILLWFWAPT